MGVGEMRMMGVREGGEGRKGKGEKRMGEE